MNAAPSDFDLVRKCFWIAASPLLAEVSLIRRLVTISVGNCSRSVWHQQSSDWGLINLSSLNAGATDVLPSCLFVSAILPLNLLEIIIEKETQQHPLTFLTSQRLCRTFTSAALLHVMSSSSSSSNREFPYKGQFKIIIVGCDGWFLLIGLEAH